MNIVLAIQSLEIGGAERQVIELADGLRRLGHDTSICCLNRLGSLADEAKCRGIPVNCLNKRHRFDLRVISKLAEYLLSKKADVLHTFLFGANLWGTIAGRKAGVSVLLKSDRSGGYYNEKKELWADRLLKAFSDGMITNTTAGKQRIRCLIGVPSKQIHIIFNSMAWERFENKRDSVDVRRDLDIRPNLFTIVMAGTIRPVKNYMMFIEAARILSDESDQFLFLVIGGGPDIAEMQARVKQLGIIERFRFTGVRYDVPSLLQVADAGVLCSHWEGFSNAIMEYMAAGLPVVATDVGGNRDLVQQGYTGFLVRPGDAVQMAEKLKWLSTDTILARSMGGQGRAWLKDTCDFMNLVRKTAFLYESILQQKVITTR
jgi:glycosyltransferase involved in cell wall biosynthesis